MANLLILQTLLVCFIWIVTSQRTIDGNVEEVTVPVVWKRSGKRGWWKRRRTSGFCEFNTTRSYERGQVTVNVTFDRTVNDFKINDFLKWKKIDQSKGNWYLVESRFSFDAGQSLDLSFSARGSSSSLPNGNCNVRGEIEDCEADVDFGGIAIDTGGGVISGKGSCVFDIFENVDAGALNVNVTFDDTVLTFANRHVLNQTDSNPGTWYFSESLTSFVVGDTLVYEFDVTWENVNFPEGTCLANIGCAEVIPTTVPTTAGPTLPPID